MKRIGLALTSVMALVACTGDDDDDAFSGDTLVQGTLYSNTAAGETRLAGGTVEALPGGPGTTTAADGTWTLMLQSNLTATIRATADDHWGAQIATQIGPDTIYNFGAVHDDLVVAIGAA